MDWRELSVEVNNEAVEAVAALLQEKATQGVVINENGDRVKVTAYFHDNENFATLFKELKSNIEKLNDFGLQTVEISFSVNITHDEDWSTSWHRFFKPVEAGERFLICPDWEQCNSRKREVIYINPGRAFGIGSHETTRICIALLEKYISDDVVNLLDIGTGTGILAIISARLGVKEIMAVDIDPAAVDAARENVEKNGVKERVTVRHGDLAKDVQGKYSLIVANLLPDLIINLLPVIPDLMEENTRLILSGIIREKKETVLSHLHKLNLELLDEIELGEWLGLVVGKGVQDA